MFRTSKNAQEIMGQPRIDPKTGKQIDPATGRPLTDPHLYPMTRHQAAMAKMKEETATLRTVKLENIRKCAIAGVTLIASSAAAAATGDSEFGHFGWLTGLAPDFSKLGNDGYNLHKLRSGGDDPKMNPIWAREISLNKEERLFKPQDFIADAENARTKTYLQHRRMKKMGGSIYGLGGTISSHFTGVGINAPGAAKEANAVGVTMTHASKIRDIGNENLRSGMPSPDVQDWVDQICLLKEYKQYIRGTKLLGSIVPHASVVGGIASEFMKLGVELYFKLIVDDLAAEIHYVAFVEYLRKGGQGPASEIVRELFTRRGAMSVLGKYIPNEYIREPGGWKAIADKIAMI